MQVRNFAGHELYINRKDLIIRLQEILRESTLTNSHDLDDLIVSFIAELHNLSSKPSITLP